MKIQSRKPVYKEYLFKCQWTSTALKLKIPGKSYWDAERRLNTILRRMEGGELVKEIKFLGRTV